MKHLHLFFVFVVLFVLLACTACSDAGSDHQPMQEVEAVELELEWPLAKDMTRTLFDARQRQLYEAWRDDVLQWLPATHGAVHDRVSHLLSVMVLTETQHPELDGAAARFLCDFMLMHMDPVALRSCLQAILADGCIGPIRQAPALGLDHPLADDQLVAGRLAYAKILLDLSRQA